MRASVIAKMAARKSVGDILEFGRYQVQSGMKPYSYKAKVYKSMEWFVLAIEGTRMLLLSRDCVDWEFIDGTGHPQTWENCYARKELLPDLFKTCFTDEERRLIVQSKLHTENNPVYGTKGGADTTDFMFFLSIEEFRKYVFPAAAPSSLFLLEQMDIFNPEKEDEYELFWEKSVWWLRSPGEEQYCNAVVNTRGELDVEGLENGCDEIGIRPAVWIDVNVSPDMIDMDITDTVGIMRKELEDLAALLDDDLPF